MSPAVISNTGPLLALAEVEQFELLRVLFNQVIIPPAVRAEILSEPAVAAVQTALSAGWLVEQAPKNELAVRLLEKDLDAGESAAIVLAQEIQPRWLILDDLAARRLAENMGLPVIGTLGVLLKGKKAGLIAALQPLLAQLRQQSFFISDELQASVLRSAGEL